VYRKFKKPTNFHIKNYFLQTEYFECWTYISFVLYYCIVTILTLMIYFYYLAITHYHVQYTNMQKKCNNIEFFYSVIITSFPHHITS